MKAETVFRFRDWTAMYSGENLYQFRLSTESMERERAQKPLAISMIALGTLQVGLGVINDNLPFAVFGFIYALIGAAWLRL